MMTKKNLAKAVTLSLLLSTVLSTNAWALEINNETIDSSSIAADNRFVEANFDDYKLYSYANGDKIILDNVDLTVDGIFQGLTGVSEVNGGSFNGSVLFFGNSSNENADNNTIKIYGITLHDANAVFGANSNSDDIDSISDNNVYVQGSTIEQIRGGSYEGRSENVKVYNNTVCLDDSTVSEVYAGFMGDAQNNGIVVTNGTIVTGGLQAGYAYVEKNNYVTIVGEKNDLSNASISGYMMGINHEGNTLNLNGFNGDIKSIYNFDIINFDNLDFNKTEVVTVSETYGGLENTEIKISSFANGQNIKVGDKVDLLEIERGWEDSFTESNKQYQ